MYVNMYFSLNTILSVERIYFYTIYTVGACAVAGVYSI